MPIRIDIYQDKQGGWRWRAVDGNARIVADGAEAYVSQYNAQRAVENVLGDLAAGAEVRIVVEEHEDEA